MDTMVIGGAQPRGRAQSQSSERGAREVNSRQDLQILMVCHLEGPDHEGPGPTFKWRGSAHQRHVPGGHPFFGYQPDLVNATGNGAARRIGA